MKRLIKLSRNVLNKFQSYYLKIGENENKYFGRDEYYTSNCWSNENWTGQITHVQILKSNLNTVLGEIVDSIDKKNYAA